jgi:hypothetical protein
VLRYSGRYSWTGSGEAMALTLGSHRLTFYVGSSRPTGSALSVMTDDEQRGKRERHYEPEPGEAEDDVQDSQDRLPGSLETDRRGVADFVHQRSSRHGLPCP